ncbi:ABC transporter substrate-binding protein [Streptomyces sp. NPDC047000]|uniref:ABC transporter substrate-binding protein n=1 Tax=Streptomyces sp. NPDC047000 TaxID=3155474 RepID=UPI0033D0B1E8
MLMRRAALRHRLSRRGAVPAFLVTAGLLAAGCGSSASAAKSSDGTVAVTVGVSGANVNILPVWVAQKKGFFAAHHVNVKLAVLTPTITNSALTSGSVQFLAGSAKNFLTAVEHGTDQLTVAQTSTGVPLGLVISTKYAKAHHITAATPLATVARELVGSTGGSSSESTTAEANLFLRRYGVDTGKMKVATLSSPTIYQSALKSGRIDWFCTSEPTPLQAQAAGAGVVVANSKNVPAWASDRMGPGNITITKKSYASGHPDVVSDFTQAMQDAVKYIHDNEGSAALTDIAAAESPGVPRAILKEAISEIDWPENSRMTAEQWTTGVRFTVSIGAAKASTTVKEGTDWTNKYLG